MIPRFIGRRRTAAVTALLAVSAIGLAACGSSGGSGAADPSTSGSAAPPAALSTLRVGFFPNVTHAPAFVALQEGFLKTTLAEVKVKVAPSLFNAGPDAVTALFGGAVDISYIGPNPTVSAWTQSQGEAVTVISGAASAGASLVVKPELTSAESLRGKTLATPQLGNTQDVALRYWLKEQGLATDAQTGSGDVNITPMANSEAVTAFQSGAIDGAWVPEPFASQLVAAGGRGARRRGHAVARWPVRHHRHRGAYGVPQGAPGRRRGVPAREHPGRRVHQVRPGAGPGRLQRRPQGPDRIGSRRGPAGHGLEEHRVHGRPAQGDARRVRGPRGPGRAARPGQDRRGRRLRPALRPDAAQQGPGGAEARPGRS